MTVRYYEFGKKVGGTESGGGTAVPAEAPYGPGEPVSGTLIAGNTTITFANATKRVTVRNTHDTQSLDYSLDSGTTWQTLAAYGEISEPVNLSSLILRNTGAVATTYEVVGILT